MTRFLPLCLSLLLIGPLAGGALAAESRSSLCQKLLKDGRALISRRAMNHLETSHPNKLIYLNLYVPTSSYWDQSASSGQSAYIPLRTRLAINKVSVLEYWLVTGNMTRLYLRGRPKAMANLLWDLELQSQRLERRAFYLVEVGRTSEPIDAYDSDQVEEVMNRFVFSPHASFPGFGGVGIGMGPNRSLRLVVRILEGQNGPTKKVETFEGIDVVYEDSRPALAQ